MTASALSQATMQPAGYAAWIADVKLRIRAAQQRAALAVNKELLQLYWQIGRDILDRQAEIGWGTGILSQIEADLRVEFPEMRGFSQTNLKYMRMFAEAWPDPSAMGQRFVDQLPWGQNITLLTKLKTREEWLLYAARAVEHGWSRPLLTHHIELRTLEREGNAVTNFDQRLPKPRSDLARETLKDPYRFERRDDERRPPCLNPSPTIRSSRRYGTSGRTPASTQGGSAQLPPRGVAMRERALVPAFAAIDAKRFELPDVQQGCLATAAALAKLGFDVTTPSIEGAFVRIYAFKNAKKPDAKLVLPFRGAVKGSNRWIIRKRKRSSTDFARRPTPRALLSSCLAKRLATSSS